MLVLLTQNKAFPPAKRCTTSVQSDDCVYTFDDQTKPSQFVHRTSGLLGCFDKLLALSFKRLVFQATRGCAGDTVLQEDPAGYCV
jgi:hypothetical protein